MSGDDSEKEPVATVHAGSVAPASRSDAPKATAVDDETPDAGWSSPEAAPPPDASGPSHSTPDEAASEEAEDSVAAPPAPSAAMPQKGAPPASAPDAPAPSTSAEPSAPVAPPTSGAPPAGASSVQPPGVPASPTILEAPDSGAPPTAAAPSAPSGSSRRLAPPPKPKKSVPSADANEADEPPVIQGTPYEAPLPPAPGLPDMGDFPPQEPDTGQRTQSFSSRVAAPPRPNSTPPLSRSNPPPAFLAALEQGELFKSPAVPRDLPGAEQPATPRGTQGSMPDISVGEASEDDLGSVRKLAVEPAVEAGAELSEPRVERRSEIPPPTHIVVPGDEVPPASKPTPAPAIHVMRIIAVGTPRAAVPPGVASADVPEHLSGDDITEEDVHEPRALREEPEELSEDDVAPDSGPEAAISIPPEELELPEEEARAKAEGRDPKPPPPPRRPPQRDKDAPAVKSKRQKRPWWEEMFSEDFVRSSFKVSDAQVVREVNFIEESLGVAPGGVVLDLGCGSGHHAVELAGRGYGVVGYDLSLYQLALAAEVAQEKDQKLNFLQGDMREMAFDAMFDGVYCWNTTFGYFEEEKNLNVAQRVFRALKPGGMFLIDVVNRDFAAVQSPSSLWFEGDSCVCMDDMSVDFISSRLRVKRAIILDDGRTKECSYSIRLYSLHELGKLLHDVGFRVAEASGQPSMPGVFFGPNSPRIIMLAQKPELGANGG